MRKLDDPVEDSLRDLRSLMLGAGLTTWRSSPREAKGEK